MNTVSAIAQLIVEVLNLAYRLARLWREAKQKKWVENIRSISQQIEAAETDEDRRKLAKLLFDYRAR